MSEETTSVYPGDDVFPSDDLYPAGTVADRYRDLVGDSPRARIGWDVMEERVPGRSAGALL